MNVLSYALLVVTIMGVVVFVLVITGITEEIELRLKALGILSLDWRIRTRPHRRRRKKTSSNT